MKNSLDDKMTALGKRARDCYEKFVNGALWDEIVAAEPLMLYSKEFRDFVAGKCGVNPESGKPLEEPTDEELADEIDDAVDGGEVDEANDEAEAEEADADEAEAIEEEEEEEEEEPAVAASHNDCHWCGAAPATICLSVQAQDGDGGNRLVRLDHLCDGCAAAYWTAIHNAQKERMF